MDRLPASRELVTHEILVLRRVQDLEQANQPTFSESWYRVADLTPRLITAVKVHGQQFRGRKWYVVQDPVNNQFFRLSETAYYFTAMLDGRHTVEQVWRHCMDKFEDAAPTQG